MDSYNNAAPGLRLWELRRTNCRWPLGERWDSAEFFCGEPTAPNCSYCKEHRQRAYVRAYYKTSAKHFVIFQNRRK